jgi:hydroxyacylglutathione hydrolase
MPAWIEAGYELVPVPQISVGELEQQRRRAGPFVLDVRSRAEWVAGHVEGAVHMPGGDLPKRTGEIPKDTQVHVICASYS